MPRRISSTFTICTRPFCAYWASIKNNSPIATPAANSAQPTSTAASPTTSWHESFGVAAAKPPQQPTTAKPLHPRLPSLRPNCRSECQDTLWGPTRKHRNQQKKTGNLRIGLLCQFFYTCFAMIDARRETQDMPTRNVNLTRHYDRFVDDPGRGWRSLYR